MACEGCLGTRAAGNTFLSMWLAGCAHRSRRSTSSTAWTPTALSGALPSAPLVTQVGGGGCPARHCLDTSVVVRDLNGSQRVGWVAHPKSGGHGIAKAPSISCPLPPCCPRVPAESGSDLGGEYARQRNYLEKTIDSLKRKLAADAEAHRTDELRIMGQNVSLIQELNELRREIKVSETEAGCRTSGAGKRLSRTQCSCAKAGRATPTRSQTDRPLLLLRADAQVCPPDTEHSSHTTCTCHGLPQQQPKP